MPSLTGTFVRYLARVGLHLLFYAFVGMAGLLGACSYSEETKWQACCRMRIVENEQLASGTIAGLVSRLGFDAVTGEALGRLAPRPIGVASTRQDILIRLNEFLASHPKDHPKDYFLTLGMSCTPISTAAVGETRCEVELPIQVECHSRNLYAVWGTSVPNELQKPIPARLYWSVDVSHSAMLGTSARVLPLPGGRLCHR